jgi:radical SAM superfamily enzyme YgiQ (UPF0313 family)
MKILYIYPTGLDEQGRPIKYEKAYLPPLSLAILNRLTPAHHDVEIINECVEEIDFSTPYDLVGISVLTYQAPRAYQISKKFREKGVKVILGGIHPSLFTNEAIKNADAVVIGEAENIWTQVLSDVEKGRIQSIYKCDTLPDLKQRCIPKWENVNLDIYRQYPGNKKMPRMPIYSTKGCIHECKYCAVTKFFGHKFRYKPVSLVLEEIDSVNADSYFFVDDNIGCSYEYSEELFKAVAKKNIRWISQTSTNILRYPKLIELAAQAGCRNLFFGIESISKKNLQSVRKNFNNPDRYLELIYRMEAVGIRPWISIIIGFDDDDFEQLRTTIKFLKKAKVANVVLFILTPLPGTELFEEMEHENRIFDKNWSNYDTCHVVFQPKHFTPSQLEKEFWKMYKEFYSLKSVLTKAIGGMKRNIFNSSLFLNDLRIQIYTYRQIKRKEHPFSMGIGRYSSERSE